jgi:hypothetical protein
LCGSCLNRVTSIYRIKSIRLLDYDVTCDVCSLKNVRIFGQFEYFDQDSSFCLLFFPADCECNRLSFCQQCLIMLSPSTKD